AARRKIVDDEHFVAALKIRVGKMRANETSTACNEYAHVNSPISFRRFYSLRSLTKILMALLGRNKIAGQGSITCPSARTNLKFCRIAAITRTASIIANSCPMQTLGPPPNGK